jgi:hypothetical protein
MANTVTIIIAAKNLLGRTLNSASGTIRKWAAGIASRSIRAAPRSSLR